jgi:hypothetical protein
MSAIAGSPQLPVSFRFLSGSRPTVIAHVGTAEGFRYSRCVRNGCFYAHRLYRSSLQKGLTLSGGISASNSQSIEWGIVIVVTARLQSHGDNRRRWVADSPYGNQRPDSAAPRRKTRKSPWTCESYSRPYTLPECWTTSSRLVTRITDRGFLGDGQCWHYEDTPIPAVSRSVLQ